MGFTLIELLVVIAIIAILAIVVILTLNPGQLLAQARDSTRLQDIATISDSLNVAASENFTSSAWGNASTTYLSVIDSTATSTSGTDCTGVGLAAPAGGGFVNHCAASSTETRPDGTGWLPANLSKLSIGSLLSSLPVDPANTTSSNAYYTYETNGTVGRYKLTAFFESQKYLPQMANDGGIDGALYEAGNALTLPSGGRGLVGYWSFDEGGGAVVVDQSGNGNTGTWIGSLIGGSHYAAGKIGGAGNFDGAGNYVITATNGFPLGNSPRSVFAWVYFTGASPNYYVYGYGDSTITGATAGLRVTPAVVFQGVSDDFASSFTVTPNAWHFVGFTYGGGTSIIIYYDGQSQTGTLSTPLNTVLPGSDPSNIGQKPFNGGFYFGGQIDDVRLYSRALSAPEVVALYNAEK
jgi:prepilin-type N-terminal cleavage/methylation domain-containing protein